MLKLVHRFMMIGALLVLASCDYGTGNFLLVNNAAEPIFEAHVVICDQEIELHDIPPGNSASGFYDVKFDSHYSVKIEFQSGKELRGEVGYVTNREDIKHVITVTDSDIQIKMGN